MHRPALVAFPLLLLLQAGRAHGGEPEASDFERSVPGVCVRYRDPLGNPAQVEGVLEREDASTLTIRSVDGQHEIERSRVIEIAALTLDPRTIYTAAELLARYVATRRARHAADPALSSEDHWHVALYAEWLEAWAAARDHYARAAADPMFPRHVAAAGHVERIDARLREAAARAVLKQAELDLRLSRFRKVRTALATFLEAHPHIPEGLRIRHVLLRKAFTVKRDQILGERTVGVFCTVVRRLIRSQVEDVDVSINDTTAWSRRELPDTAFAAVAASLGNLDDVSPEEVVRFWEERRRTGSRTASYGSGTYIVHPLRAPADPPPTRDAWWDAATTAERAAWALALFVERSGLFELRRRERAPCPTCGGTGRIGSAICGGCLGQASVVVLHYR